MPLRSQLYTQTIQISFKRHAMAKTTCHGYSCMPWLQPHATATCHGYSRMPWLQPHAMATAACHGHMPWLQPGACFSCHGAS